jgi:hypothetical protein
LIDDAVHNVDVFVELVDQLQQIHVLSNIAVVHTMLDVHEHVPREYETVHLLRGIVGEL